MHFVAQQTIEYCIECTILCCFAHIKLFHILVAPYACIHASALDGTLRFTLARLEKHLKCFGRSFDSGPVLVAVREHGGQRLLGLLESLEDRIKYSSRTVSV